MNVPCHGCLLEGKKKKRRKKTREGEKFNVVLTCDFVPSMIKNKLRGLCGMNDDLDNDNHGDELKEERKISNKMQKDF